MKEEGIPHTASITRPTLLSTPAQMTDPPYQTEPPLWKNHRRQNAVGDKKKVKKDDTAVPGMSFVSSILCRVHTPQEGNYLVWLYRYGQKMIPSSLYTKSMCKLLDEIEVD